MLQGLYSERNAKHCTAQKEYKAETVQRRRNAKLRLYSTEGMQSWDCTAQKECKAETVQRRRKVLESQFMTHELRHGVGPSAIFSRIAGRQRFLQQRYLSVVFCFGYVLLWLCFASVTFAAVVFCFSYACFASVTFALLRSVCFASVTFSLIICSVILHLKYNLRCRFLTPLVHMLMLNK